MIQNSITQLFGKARNRRLRGELPQLLSASLWMVATGLGGQFLLLISGLLTARMLGVTGRGYLAGLSIWPMLLTSLGNLGIPVACTYYLSQNPARTRQILGEVYRFALVQSMVLSGLLAIVLFFWSYDKPDEVRIAVYPTLILVPIMLGHQYALAILQSQQRFTAFNVLCLSPAALYTFTVVVLFLLGEDRLLPIVVAWVSTFIVAAIASTAVALRHERFDWQGVPELRRQLMAFGLRGHLGAVSPVDSLPIDQAAIALFLTPAALGLYVVAYAFTNLPRLIARCVGIVIYPAVAVRQGTRSALRLVWWSFAGVTLLNIFCTASLIVGMPLLIPFFFGSEFTPAVLIACILLVGTTLAASRRILVEGLRGLGSPGVSTVAEVSMYPWLAVGGPWLMSQYGAEGMATALAVGYGLSLFVAIIASIRLASTTDVPFTLLGNTTESGT